MATHPTAAPASSRKPAATCRTPCTNHGVALEYRAAGQRGLVAAGATLVVHPACTAKPRAGPAVAPWTTKSLRPARPVQRPIALRLGVVPLHELRHRQSRMELHLIHGQDGSAPRHMAPRLRYLPLTSGGRRLSEVANQVPLQNRPLIPPPGGERDKSSITASQSPASPARTSWRGSTAGRTPGRCRPRRWSGSSPAWCGRRRPGCRPCRSRAR